MSLNSAQRAQTSAELRANCRLSRLTAPDVQAGIGLSADQLEATLDLAPTSRPETVWLLRDYLVEVIEARSEEPHPYTVLTDDMRSAAARWFPLRQSRLRARP